MRLQYPGGPCLVRRGHRAVDMPWDNHTSFLKGGQGWGTACEPSFQERAGKTFKRPSGNLGLVPWKISLLSEKELNSEFLSLCSRVGLRGVYQPFSPPLPDLSSPSLPLLAGTFY